MSTNQPSLTDKLLEKVKAIMPDLIGDSEIKDLIARAINDSVFKPRTVPDGSYSTKTKPPLIEELALEAFKAEISKALSLFMVENKELIAQKFQEVLKDGLGSVMISAMNAKLADDFYNLKMSLQAKGIFNPDDPTNSSW